MQDSVLMMLNSLGSSEERSTCVDPRITMIRSGIDRGKTG